MFQCFCKHILKKNGLIKIYKYQISLFNHFDILYYLFKSLHIDLLAYNNLSHFHIGFTETIYNNTI